MNSIVLPPVVLRFFNKLSSYRYEMIKSLVAVLTIALLSVSLRTNNFERPFSITKSTEAGSPFESSNTTARFALTEALATTGKYTLTDTQARFSVPDVVEANGDLIISFMPGISFLAVPLYKIGEVFELQNFMPFLLNIMFATANGAVIVALARRFKANWPSALLASATFLFATNALGYTGTLTQHHASTFMLLLSILNAFHARTWWRNLLFGLYCGAGFLFDFPNLFFLFPVGLYILAQHVSIKTIQEKYQVSLRLGFMLIAVTLALGLGVALFYNAQTTGSPTVFAQFSGRTNRFDTEQKKEQDRLMELNRDPYESRLPFVTRIQLRGANVLLLSDERSWLWYSPVVLLGVAGLWLLWKQEKNAAGLLLSVVTVNILIYTLFGDPWGGWSFGPRYLIPAAALLCATLSVAFTNWNRSKIFIPLFVALLAASVWISTAGALTTNSIPPKQEAQNLSVPIPYTWKYNQQKLAQDKSYSLVHRSLFGTVSSQYFHKGYVSVLGVMFISLITLVVMKRKEQA